MISHDICLSWSGLLTGTSMILSRAIHVAANGITSFFCMTNIPHFLYLFICQWTLGCFHARLIIFNNITPNLHVLFLNIILRSYLLLGEFSGWGKNVF